MAAAGCRGAAAQQPVRHPCPSAPTLPLCFQQACDFIFGHVFPFLFRAHPSWGSGRASGRAEPRGGRQPSSLPARRTAGDPEVVIALKDAFKDKRGLTNAAEV